MRLSGIILLSIMSTTPSLGFEFHPPDGSDLSNAIEKQFVLPMLQDHEEPAPFEWAAGDVDGDDYDELFIKLALPELCTADGCPIIGFIRIEDGSWRPILTAVGSALDGNEEGRLDVISGPNRTPYRYDGAVQAMLPSENKERAP